MDAKTIRRINVRALAEEVGGVTVLAGMTATSQSYLSQIIGPQASRQVGDTLARKLEQATGRPYGWLDESHFSDTKRDKARKVFDTLLELPEAKIDAVMQLLNMESGSENQVTTEASVGQKANETGNRRKRPG